MFAENEITFGYVLENLWAELQAFRAAMMAGDWLGALHSVIRGYRFLMAMLLGPGVAVWVYLLGGGFLIPNGWQWGRSEYVTVGEGLGSVVTLDWLMDSVGL